MKRSIILLLLLMLTLTASACSDNNRDMHSDTQSNAGPSAESVYEESSRDEKKLLEDSFGALFSSDEFCIKAGITVESGILNGEINSYELTVAADKSSQKAMIEMLMPDGKQARMIVKNNYSYQLEEDGTYKKQLYTEEVDEFVKPYTKELYLGVTEPLIYEASGVTEIDPDKDGKTETADFVKYRLSENEISSDKGSEVYITYYFIDDKPVMEVMEKTGGRTTFIFRELSPKVKDVSVFETDQGNIQE